MHAISARLLIVVASGYTAFLQLFSPNLLAYRAAGDSLLMDVINWGVVLLAGIALSDLIWRDVLRRGLILPSVKPYPRHQICVAVYSALAAAFGIRAFMAAGDLSIVWQVGTYYVLVAAGIAVEAAAIANEERQECPPESKSD
jgi:hypothetical protein